MASDSPGLALIMFIVEGELIYLDKPVDSGFATYEDRLSLLEICPLHYRDAGLDLSELAGLIR